jgi:hypothetical protein
MSARVTSPRLQRKRKLEDRNNQLQYNLMYPEYNTWAGEAGFDVRQSDAPVPETVLKQFPQIPVQPLRKKKPNISGSCVQHPVAFPDQQQYYMLFNTDEDTLQSNEVIRKYTLETTNDANMQRWQLTNIPPGVYNYILFSDLANTSFTLHIMYMNPMEYYSKHSQLIFDAKHVRNEYFMYSGEILLNGTPNIVASDISSLYFQNVKADSIKLAFELLFTDIGSFEVALGPKGMQYYKSQRQHYNANEPFTDAALKAMFNIFYNKADVGFLQPWVRPEIDKILQKLFVQFMQYALSTIFGPIAVQYATDIYNRSSQRFLNKDFVDALCRVKAPQNYPPVYYDDTCTKEVPNNTWCTY